MRKILFILLFLPLFTEGQKLVVNGWSKGASCSSGTPVFDTYPGKAGYSLAKLKTGETVAVRVRRSSDNTEQDIGFCGNDFDIASYSSFVGAGQGFVVTWYDQSGNNYDLTQATTANQPEIILSHWGTRAAVFFDGTNDYLEVASFMGSATAGSVFMVTNIVADPPAAGAQTGHLIYASFNGANSHYPWTDGIIYDGFGTTARKTTVNPTPSLATLNLYTVVSAASAWESFLNNTSIFSTGTNSVLFSTPFRLGFQNATYYFNGYAGEVLIFDSALSSGDRNGVSGVLNSYYSIY